MLAPGCAPSTSATQGLPDLGVTDGPVAPVSEPDGGDASLIWVPPGVFRMGCQSMTDKQCQADELPDHDVTLHGFFIDRTEVTHFTAADMDFIRHYRPRNNVVERPTENGGERIMLTGHHEVMFPLLAAAIREELAGTPSNSRTKKR